MARADAHRRRILRLTGGSVQHDQAHPIYNFLFEYYHFKPRTLLQWSPGLGVHLLDADPSAKGCPLPEKGWVASDGGGCYDAATWSEKRARSVRWIRDFVRASGSHAPVLHCFGLHEWAMLYSPRAAAAAAAGQACGAAGGGCVEEDGCSRHQDLPLRLAQQELDEVVERNGVSCTHFDAFRFFAPEARPLNAAQLTREGQAATDQPGCVHANMDLFKWALKLFPFLPSETLGDALELAVACRVLDMRASPYDLSTFQQPHPGVWPQPSESSSTGPGPGPGPGAPRPDSDLSGSSGSESSLPAAPARARATPDGPTLSVGDLLLDLSPVCVETEEGRREYQVKQWELYRASLPVRRRLLEHLDAFLSDWRGVHERPGPGQGTVAVAATTTATVGGGGAVAQAGVEGVQVQGVAGAGKVGAGPAKS